MSDIVTLLNAARDRALKGGLPTRRRDGALYALLSGCLFICEKVQREGLEAELRRAVQVSVDERGKGNAGKGRRYAEKDSDAYILVCRHVLEGVDTRNSVYRYAVALREAAARQVSSPDLSKWLKDNGGVSALFNRARVVNSRRVQLMQLDRSIEYPTDRPFTLTLRYDGKGGFVVQAPACDVPGDPVS